MQPRFVSVKSIGRKVRKLNFDDDKSYAVAIFIALVIVSSVIAGYYLVLRPQPERYNTIYLLDAQEKAVDYPETLVVNKNSTFNVYVGVVNHMGQSVDYQVRVKITKNVSTFPVDTEPSQVFDTGSVANGSEWQTIATITENQPGSYMVVFELWQKSGDTYAFTGDDYCSLNIQVN
jgi:uncharacterized membrane protein